MARPAGQADLNAQDADRTGALGVPSWQELGLRLFCSYLSSLQHSADTQHSPPNEPTDPLNLYLGRYLLDFTLYTFEFLSSISELMLDF